MRHYPALDLAWPDGPSDDEIALIVAALDDDGLTGLEETTVGVRMFFRTPAMRDRAANRLPTLAPDISCLRVDVADEQWAERSQAALQPIRVGRLVVAPPWALLSETECRTAGLVQIVIRPAMGFGTGHHASTRLCLELLQQVNVTGAFVTDVGTGSGVLALAAARLGAREVLGLDHDPDALESARDSAALNPGATVKWQLADLQGGLAPGLADLVCANLTGDLLAREAGAIVSLATADGALVLSGILASEAASVEAAFEVLSWHRAERRQEDEWVGLLLRRGSPDAPTSPTATTTR